MKFLSLPPYYLKNSAKYTRKSRDFVKIFEILSLMVGAGGAIINYLFPGAREAPESKGAENIVSMEDIRLEQGLHEECGVFGIYDPEGSCAPPVPVWYLWPPCLPAVCESFFRFTCATTLPLESFTSRLPQSSTPRKSEQVP